ncbi:MAG: hypothetical protein HY842_15265 [Bacteroidetes bacterium]|nr:hypothetical protein [Bacteroidota bacterium]
MVFYFSEAGVLPALRSIRYGSKIALFKVFVALKKLDSQAVWQQNGQFFQSGAKVVY